MVFSISGLGVLSGREDDRDRAHELELGVFVVDDDGVAGYCYHLARLTEDPRPTIPIETVYVVDRRDLAFLLVVPGHMSFAVQEVQECWLAPEEHHITRLRFLSDMCPGVERGIHYKDRVVVAVVDSLLDAYYLVVDLQLLKIREAVRS